MERSRQHLKDFARSCGRRNAKALNPGKAVVEGALLEHDDDRNTVHGKTTLSTPNQSIKRNHFGRLSLSTPQG